jgi:epoxyqueuosine reductase
LTGSLKQAVQNEARRLGFTLAGVTTPDPPPHLEVFENWLAEGRHGAMGYLGAERARARRADPRQILPECRSILVLAIPYPNPAHAGNAAAGAEPRGRVASYAWGTDYHLVLPERLQALVAFIESRVGHPVPNRCYTDTGPLLERELAQRAGLGWIARNTCLIHPRHGSYFLLAEILLGLELEPDPPFVTDHCGTCTRCLDACPTHCILPDRTLDARRCISYLTIELKDEIPADLRPLLGEWVFGCDVCQQVCPWNRFADAAGEPAFAARAGIPLPVLQRELELTPQEFSQRFRSSPVKRAGRRGYLRNVAVALGNSNSGDARPALERALDDPDPLVREHAAWALKQIA